MSSSGKVVRSDVIGDDPRNGAAIISHNGDIFWSSSGADSARTQWFLSSAGDDRNDGTSAKPLRTVAELNRRIGAEIGTITANITVTFLTSHEGGALVLDVALGCCVKILGTPTVVTGSMVATYTSQSSSTNRATLLTFQTIADVASVVGVRARTLSGLGATSNEVIWGTRADPYSLGAGTLECCPPTVDSMSLGVVNVYAGTSLDATTYLQFEALPEVTQLAITCRNSDGSVLNNPLGTYGDVAQVPSVYVASLHLQHCALATSRRDQSAMVVWGCEIDDLATNAPRAEVVSVLGCKLNAIHRAVASAQYGGCAVVLPTGSLLEELECSSRTSWSYSTWVGVGVTFSMGVHNFLTSGVFASPVHGVRVLDGATVHVNAFLGQGNASFGALVTRNGTVICDATSFSGCKITGASGDASFGLSGGVAVAWTAMPRALASGAGTGTLAAGDLVVAIASLPSDAIVQPTYKVPKSAPGILTVQSQTSSGFTVRSLDGTDSTSTVNWSWRSPKGGAGGYFLQQP
jgi:hypothetical protein